ncbi:MAG: cell division protein ZapA [Nitrospirota bacterium]|nr:cell division protein ZapA [Nitrospirota bacterium]
MGPSLVTKAIEVDVYGYRLALQGEADETYVQELVQYVEGQMDRVAQGLATTTPTKIAILAALNIADQLFQQEHRRQASEAEIERRALGMLEGIDAQLENSSPL